MTREDAVKLKADIDKILYSLATTGNAGQINPYLVDATPETLRVVDIVRETSLLYDGFEITVEIADAPRYSALADYVQVRINAIKRGYAISVKCRP